MTLRIFPTLLAVSFLFGAAGSVNAAEQVTNQSKSALEMKAGSSTKKNDFKPRKRKKAKSRKRGGGCEAYGG
jgi:hypothetical protein